MIKCVMDDERKRNERRESLSLLESCVGIVTCVASFYTKGGDDDGSQIHIM